tara:strand:- start:730 stop:903 length:174 start_codon:yes stop_codon:yes gene_type:complete
MKSIDDKKDFRWSIIVIGLLAGVIWYSIFTNGFFITVTWLIIISAIIGLWLRLTGRS